MTEPVHLVTPLSFNSRGIAKTYIQESPEEVANCVFAILLCFEGFREDLPEFGIPDMTFEQLPLGLDTLRAAVQRWEPRAQLSLEEAEEALTEARRRITVEVGAP